MTFIGSAGIGWLARTHRGMLEFRQAALLKIAAGVTSTEELLRVLPAQQLMADVWSDA